MNKTFNQLGATVKAVLWGNGDTHYFIEFDSLDEYLECRNFVCDFAKLHKMKCKANFTSWRYILKPEKSRKEIEEEQEKEKKQDKLRYIFEMTYHNTMNGDAARKAQINFIKEHKEYKEIFCNMYNSSYYENLL